MEVKGREREREKKSAERADFTPGTLASLKKFVIFSKKRGAVLLRRLTGGLTRWLNNQPGDD